MKAFICDYCGETFKGAAAEVHQIRFKNLKPLRAFINFERFKYQNGDRIAGNTPADICLDCLPSVLRNMAQYLEYKEPDDKVYFPNKSAKLN